MNGIADFHYSPNGVREGKQTYVKSKKGIKNNVYWNTVTCDSIKIIFVNGFLKDFSNIFQRKNLISLSQHLKIVQTWMKWKLNKFTWYVYQNSKNKNK